MRTLLVLLAFSLLTACAAQQSARNGTKCPTGVSGTYCDEYTVMPN